MELYGDGADMSRREETTADPSLFRGTAQKEKTCGSDRIFVQEIYESSFRSCIGNAETLLFHGLGWGNDEVKILVEALHFCSSLNVLVLSSNQISDISPLAVAFKDNHKLQHVEVQLENNPLPNDLIARSKGTPFLEAWHEEELQLALALSHTQ